MQCNRNQSINQSIKHFWHFNVYTISNNHHLNEHLTHCAHCTEFQRVREREQKTNESGIAATRESRSALCCCLCNLCLNQMATPTPLLLPVHTDTCISAYLLANGTEVCRGKITAETEITSQQNVLMNICSICSLLNFAKKMLFL